MGKNIDKTHSWNLRQLYFFHVCLAKSFSQKHVAQHVLLQCGWYIWKENIYICLTLANNKLNAVSNWFARVAHFKMDRSSNQFEEARERL